MHRVGFRNGFRSEDSKKTKTTNHLLIATLPGKDLNSVLYDAWAACGEGNWKTSKFLLKIRERHSTKCRGVRRWLSMAELVVRFGEDLARQLANRKLLDEELKEKETRFHPEFPGQEDCIFCPFEC